MPKKTKKEKPEPKVPLVDPVLPLPYGTGLPFLKDGEGADILNATSVKTIELTFRAAWVMWEQAEALAKKNYPRLIDGPMANGAEAALEAVIAFRTALANKGEIQRFTEKEAQKLRAGKSARRSGTVGKVLPGQNDDKNSATCTHENKKRIKAKSGEKLWKCVDCGEKWARTSPSEPLQRPNKGSKPSRGSISTSKKDSGKKKSKKKSLKAR